MIIQKSIIKLKYLHKQKFLLVIFWTFSMVLHSSFQCSSVWWLKFSSRRVRVQLITSHQHPEVFTGRILLFKVPLLSSSSVLKSTKGCFHVFLTDFVYMIFLSFAFQLFVGVFGVFLCYVYIGVTQWQGSSPVATASW